MAKVTKPANNKSSERQISAKSLAVRSARLRHFLHRTVTITPGEFYALSRPLLRNGWLAAYILLPILAAQLSLFWRPVVGVYVTALALVAFVVLALRHEAARFVALAASTIPLAMMVNLSLPQTSAFNQTVILYDTLLFLALAYQFMFMHSHPLPSKRFSVRDYGLWLALMLVVGQILGLISYALLGHQFAFGGTSLPLLAVASATFAFAEELLFHGLIQQRAAQILHPAMAALLSSLLFVVLSIGHTNILVPTVALITGGTLSFIYYKQQNLILTTTANIISKLIYLGLLASFTLR